MYQNNMKATPGNRAIRLEDWEFEKQQRKDRAPVIMLGFVCGVGTALFISAWVLLIQEVAARMRKQT